MDYIPDFFEKHSAAVHPRHSHIFILCFICVLPKNALNEVLASYSKTLQLALFPVDTIALFGNYKVRPSLFTRCNRSDAYPRSAKFEKKSAKHILDADQ